MVNDTGDSRYKIPYEGELIISNEPAIVWDIYGRGRPDHCKISFASSENLMRR